MKRFLVTRCHHHYGLPFCRWAEINDEGYVDGETPIEDYGQFIILDEEISPQSGARLLSALMYHDGKHDSPRWPGDEESCDGIPITHHDPESLPFSLHRAPALTPGEYAVFLGLVGDDRLPRETCRKILDEL